MKIPVIIPFYKNQAQLDRCFKHLGEQTIASDIEIMVRDNSEDNILFTAAVNEGLRRFAWQPELPYVMALNQDAYLEPDAIERLRDFMEANRECGIAAPLQVSTEDTESVIWGGSLDAFPFGVHVTGRRSQFTEPVEPPWINGCCMLMRTQMIREIGLLDQNMRFICSDSDYAFTARARGWRVSMVPQAVVAHEVGASSGQGAANPEIENVKIRDVLYFANKWLTGGLYKALAYEGPSLEPEKINNFVRRLSAALPGNRQKA